MMSVAQRMQHVLHRVIGLPVVMDYDADHAGKDVAAVGANPIEGQKSSRGDVQPLGLAAEAKTCFVQVFDLRAAYFLAHRIDEVFKSTGARTAHPGNGCRDQADGEEIAHQLGQAVLRQEMSVQEINDHRANPRAVLYRCRHPCGERCLGSLAALRAGADMGAMLSNDRRTWLGHVKYLPRGMARGHCCHQRRPTVDAALGIIIASGAVTCRKVSPGCPFCPPRGLPDGSRKLLVRAGFFSPSLDGGLPLLLLLRPSRRSNSAILSCRPSINSLSAAFSARSFSICAARASSLSPAGSDRFGS